MQKRLVVYSITKEKTRLAFEAAIHEIDENCVEVIDQHAYAFHSDKTKEVIFKLFTETGIDCPPDEFFILTLDRPFEGNGEATHDLKAFLLR